MKRLQTVSILLMLFIASLAFTNCSNNQTQNLEEVSLENSANFKNLKANFIEDYYNIILSSKKVITPSKFQENQFTIYEISNKKNKDKSYYIEFNDKSFFVKGDRAYNTETPDLYLEFKRDEKGRIDFEKNNSFEYRNRSGCSWRYGLCAVGCGAAGMAIASSDGPAPFMDALAVAYVTECGWSCAEKHC